jgi:cytidine deaminase
MNPLTPSPTSSSLKIPSNKALQEKAQELLHHAYAPYSRFRVAALVVGNTGQCYSGVNVENASYGLTMCAERVAIGNAITAGERQILKVLVMTDTPSFTFPCGACRQVLREFGTDIRIVLATLSGKSYSTSLKKLLPHSFGPENLQPDSSS